MMKHKVLFALVPLMSLCAVNTDAMAQEIYAENVEEAIAEFEPSEQVDSVPLLPVIDSAYFQVRDIETLLREIPMPQSAPPIVNRILAPWIFSGYRNVKKTQLYTPMNPSLIEGLEVIEGNVEPVFEMIDSVENPEAFALLTGILAPLDSIAPPVEMKEKKPLLPIVKGESIPEWLRQALTYDRIQLDFIYEHMLDNPSTIFNSYWDLPVPPVLPEDDVSLSAFIRKLDLPDVDVDKAALPKVEKRQIHWLHNVNGMMQFSQAYISDNWYQGGNDHLSLLMGFNWNVQLNPVYHPDLLFQSNLSYKLGFNSTPQDEVHSYSISEDILQYNLNVGYKAIKKWYYSMNATFKTQLLKNYENNSMVRKASFLSPGDLNIGLGMSYSTINKPKTFQLTATISPLSYNLKTCITDAIDHEKFDIRPWKKTKSDVGSNAEFNMSWKIYWNISYKTRLFLFTDYKDFLGDWEHTIDFAVNKFLSTQLYIHARYDTSVDPVTSWKKFMLREVLSFGLSYTFSTKP